MHRIQTTSKDEETIFLLYLGWPFSAQVVGGGLQKRKWFCDRKLDDSSDNISEPEDGRFQ